MPDSGASNQQHLRMMEEVERERAAFAAERARAKGAGAPSAPAPQQPPAGSAPARPVAVDLSGDAKHVSPGEFPPCAIEPCAWQHELGPF